MKADDPRHGTTRGHSAGCRETCCAEAKLRYDKRRRWEASQGFARRVLSLGALRRIQALRAIGWSVSELAAHLDVSVSQLQDYGRYPTVYATSHRAIAEMYEALATTEPPRETTSQRHGYTKTMRTAKRKGWAPPSAWLDIDDPDELPDPGWSEQRPSADDVDPVVVERILAGDYRLKATAAERAEVIARWSGSRNDLARLTGWNVTRDARQESAA